MIDLGNRYFDALALLASNPHRLVSKDRFMSEVWAGIPVTDEALTQCIRTLRRTLGDDASSPHFIETVPKHGYRFVAEVEAVSGTGHRSRAASPAARLAGATTVGSLCAGSIGGLFYGILGTGGDIAAIATVFVLTCALALLGGAGIGVGMAVTSLWRGANDWSVVLGGAAGGVVVGALGSALASSGMQSLTGVFPKEVTGLFEGLALGAASASGVVLAFQFRLSVLRAAILAIVISSAIAGATALAGGRFYGATLALLAEDFPASRLNLGGVWRLFGENGFEITSVVGTAMLEGAIFAGCIVVANLAAKGSRA